MSHPAQRRFCRMVKRKFPNLFRRTNVIDVGSLDINGNNRRYFKKCWHLGVDIIGGENVDRIGKAHEVLAGLLDVYCYKNPLLLPDVVISTEMLEHDKTWAESLQAMYNILRAGGLLLITCAGVGRMEHGTHDAHPEDSPGTNDYYKNVSNEMFASVIKADMFTEYYLRQYKTDLQFYGIKK